MRVAIWIAAAGLVVLLAIGIGPGLLSPFGNRLDSEDDPCALLDDGARQELGLLDPNSGNVTDIDPECLYEDSERLRLTSVILNGSTTLLIAANETWDGGDAAVESTDLLRRVRDTESPIRVGPFAAVQQQRAVAGLGGTAACFVHIEVADDLVVTVSGRRPLIDEAAPAAQCAETRRVADAIAGVVAP